MGKLEDAIYQAEKAEEKKAECKRRKLERFFDHADLRNKDIKDLTWNEIEILEDERKSKIPFLQKSDSPPPEPLDPSSLSREDKIDEINKILNSDIRIKKIFERDYPEYYRAWDNIDFNEEFEQTRPSLQIEDEPIIKHIIEEIIKGFHPIEIRKSAGKTIISGFASTEIKDRQNHVLPLKVLKRALPEYLNHATIMYNHSNRPIGHIISHDFRKTWDGQSEGLYIEAELYPGNNDVLTQIKNGDLTGWSVGGIAVLKDECSKSECWANIEALKLYEISLVPRPANQLALVEGVN